MWCSFSIDIQCFAKGSEVLSRERVIHGSNDLLISSCARVWCCIHLDIDNTCFQCSSVEIV